eukprot:6208972-Pleurochrysis_carterae.AAC.2
MSVGASAIGRRTSVLIAAAPVLDLCAAVSPAQRRRVWSSHRIWNETALVQRCAMIRALLLCRPASYTVTSVPSRPAATPDPSPTRACAPDAG